MKESNNTVVFTGAGMDTESNIPDFRGKDGWWRKIDPKSVATIDSFHSNYEVFREFYSTRLKLLKNVKPHKGHYILADFEKRGIIKSIATQNVSGLHSSAGNQKLYELHGNINVIKCENCNAKGTLKDFLDGKSCSVCKKEELRPAVVLFGEQLPKDAWDLAYDSIKQSELLLVIGTSLEVYPVNQLPKLSKGKVVLINNEDLGLDSDFDMKIIGKAKAVLEQLDSLI
ncbi:MAG: NAD-dependent deacylase [Tissierellia bacterium]|nr:NAD-dependent deacylase [Tissierellia bacterium]